MAIKIEKVERIVKESNNPFFPYREVLYVFNDTYIISKNNLKYAYLHEDARNDINIKEPFGDYAKWQNNRIHFIDFLHAMNKSCQVEIAYYVITPDFITMLEKDIEYDKEEYKNSPKEF